MRWENSLSYINDHLTAIIKDSKASFTLHTLQHLVFPFKPVGLPGVQSLVEKAELKGSGWNERHVFFKTAFQTVKLVCRKEVTRDKVDSNQNIFTNWSNMNQIHQQISVSLSHITEKDPISVVSI